MALRVRPFTPADAAVVEALLASLPEGDMYAIHRDWQTDLIRHTLIAEEYGTFAGVGTIIESTYHPHHHFVAIHVTPDQRRRGVGSRLYAELDALSDDRPWMAKVRTGDETGMGFLKAKGFSPIMKTLSGTMDTSSEAVQAWAAGLPRGEVQPWDGEDRIAFAHRIEAFYARHHQWSPPAPLTDEQAVGRFMGENVYGWSVCEAPHGVGYLLDDGTHPRMVFVGALTPEHDVTTTPALIRWLVEAAAERGLTIAFEADAAMPVQWAMYESAPTLSSRDDLRLMTNDPPTTTDTHPH